MVTPRITLPYDHYATSRWTANAIRSDSRYLIVFRLMLIHLGPCSVRLQSRRVAVFSPSQCAAWDGVSSGDVAGVSAEWCLCIDILVSFAANRVTGKTEVTAVGRSYETSRCELTVFFTIYRTNFTPNHAVTLRMEIFSTFFDVLVTYR
jgi:hypothetical protein